MGVSMLAPDNFRGQPYGYLTNQLGHIGLGVLLVFLASRGWFEIAGEYPVRLHVWVIIFAGYFVGWELWLQGWRGFDSIEDTIFTCFYGAGAPLWAFYEVAPGIPTLEVNLPALDMFFLAAGAHLAIGVGFRIFQSFTAT